MRTLLTLVVILAVVLVLTSCSFKASVGNPPEDKPAASDAGKSDTADKDATEAKPESEAASKYKVKILEAGDKRDESSREITNNATEFTTATKEIFVNAGIAGLTKGDKITGTMMAVEVVTATGVKVRDAKVASADVEAPGEESTANFNFSPPEKGWPTGTYTVDIAVNGEKVDSIDISIKKAGE